MPKKNTAPAVSSGNSFWISYLGAENVLNLKAVKIHFAGGEATIIGGEPEDGKSNVIECFWLAFGGRAIKRKKPIREGQQSAKVEITCVDPESGEERFKVTRTWEYKPDGKIDDKLRVVPTGQAPLKRPQSFLDEIWNIIALIPDKFVQGGGAYRRTQLLKLVGAQDKLDDIARVRDAAYEERKLVNREVVKKKAILAGMTEPDADQPRKRTPIDDIIKMKDDAQAVIDVNRRQREQFEHLNRESITAHKYADQIEQDLKNARDAARKAKAEAIKQQRIVAKLPDNPDTQKINTDVAAIEATNRDADDAVAYDAALATLTDLEREALYHTGAIAKFDEQQDTILRKANMPMADLTIGDDDVLHQDVPFDALAHSLQYRIAVATGLELKPQLKAVFITEGSGIQGKAYQKLADDCKKHGAQLFMASSAHNKQATIIIDQGEVYQHAKKRQ